MPARTKATAPSVREAASVPCGSSVLMDNKGHYLSSAVGWDRWGDERSLHSTQRPWMAEVAEAAEAESERRSELHSRQSQEYLKQLRHFAAHLPSPSAFSPSSLALSDPSTSHSAYGSHYRFDSPTTASATLSSVPLNVNQTNFLFTSKRLGIDPTVQLSHAQSEAAAQFSPQRLAKTEMQTAAVDASGVSSAYALGYGDSHQHHRTYLSQVKGGKGGGDPAAEAAAAALTAEAVQGGRIAQGLGYAEKHPYHYRYLRQKDSTRR